MRVVPGIVLLQHQAQFAERLAVARRHRVAIRRCRRRRAVVRVAVAGGIGPVAARQRVEELGQLRLHRAAHGGHAERCERHQVAVELTGPVDQPIPAGIGDEHVAPAAAEGAVLKARLGVGYVVGELAERSGSTDGAVVVVIGVHQVVAHPAVKIIAAGAAHEPIVAQVAENAVAAVVVGRPIRGGVLPRHLRQVAAWNRHALVRVEVEQEVVRRARCRRAGHHDLAQRVVLVVKRELARARAVVRVLAIRIDRVEGEHVAGVERPQPARDHQVVDERDAIDRGAGNIAACRRHRQSLGTGDRVIPRAAVQPVAAQAAEDDVVVDVERLHAHAAGAVGLGAGNSVFVGRPVPIDVGAERRDVHRLLQRATEVDRRRLHVPRGVDELVQHVAVRVLQVQVGLPQGHDAVQGLALADQVIRVQRVGALAVAAREDAPVVTDHGVVAGAARDPVVAPTADDVVVLAVAVEAVVALHAVDEVVARLAVHLVVAADVAERCGRIVRAARRVVEQARQARQDLHLLSRRQGIGVVVVVETEEHRRRRHCPVRGRGNRLLGHEPDDVAVVAEDHVGVVGMPGRGGRDDIAGIDGRCARVVTLHLRARAAEDQVAAVGPAGRIGPGQHRRRDAVGLAEEVGTAADQVVLALVAEDHVVAAAAFHVVLPVGRGAVVRGEPRQHAGRARAADGRVSTARRADAPARGRGHDHHADGVVLVLVGHEVDRAVALDHVGAQFAEEGVVARATGDVVVSAVNRDRVLGRLGVADLRDHVVAPHRRIDLLGTTFGVAARVEPGHAIGQVVAGRCGRGAVHLRADQVLETQVGEGVEVGRAIKRRVIAEHQVHARPAVDRVVAGAAEQDVLAAVAVNLVVDAIGRRRRGHDARAQRGLQRLRQCRYGLGGVALACHVLRHVAMVTEDHVVVVAVDVRRRRARRVAVEQIPAGEHRVEVLRARAAGRVGVGQHAGDEVDIEAGVAVDQVNAALAEDRVVARAAGEVVAGPAADDRVVAAAAVDREAHRRQLAGGDRGIQLARVDHVVAGVLECAGNREHEEVGVLAETVALHDGMRAAASGRAAGPPQRGQVSAGGEVLAEQVQRLAVKADLADRADQHAIDRDQAFGYEAGAGPVARRACDRAEGGLERAACEKHRRAEADREGVFMRHRLVGELAERELVVLALVPDGILRGVAVDDEGRVDVHRGREAAGCQRCAADHQRLAVRREARHHELRHGLAGRGDPSGVPVRHGGDRDLLAQREVQIGVPAGGVGARDLPRRDIEGAGEDGARAIDLDGVAADADDAHDHGLAAADRCRRDCAALQVQRLAVEADVLDHQRAGLAGDCYRLAGREAGAGPGLGVGTGDCCGRHGGASQGIEVAARHGDGTCHRADPQRIAREQQRAAKTCAWPVVEIGDRVELGHATGGEGHLLPDRESEVLPRQVVGADDAVGLHREGTADRQVIDQRHGAFEGHGLVRHCPATGAGEQHDAARSAGLVAEAGDRERGCARRRAEHDALADRQAVGRPAEPVDTRERAARAVELELPIHLHHGIAAAVHGGDAAVIRRLGLETSERVVVRARHQRAVDIERIVALAEHDVEHLDRRATAVGGEDLLGRIARERGILDQADRAEADAAGVDARLAERRQPGSQKGTEVQARAHVQAGERGGSERALQVLVAAVVVDVERVDAHPFRRLRWHLERQRIRLARQQDGLGDGAIGAGRAAFDHQWPANAVEPVLDLREHAEVLVAGLHVVARVGDHVDGLRDVPVASRVGQHGGPLGERHRGCAARDELGGIRHHAVDAGRVADHQQVELLVAGHAVGDEVDLEGAGAEGVGLEQLPFEEAVVEPAAAVQAGQHAQHLVDAGVVAVGRRTAHRHRVAIDTEARDNVLRAAAIAERDGLAHREAVVDEAAVGAAGDRVPNTDRHLPRIEQERFGGGVVLDRAGEDTALDQLVHGHAGVGARSRGRRQGQCLCGHRARDLGDPEIAHTFDADLHAGREAVVDPAAQVAVCSACDRAAADREVAGEVLHHLHVADGRVGDAAAGHDVGLPVGDERDAHVAGRRMGQALRVAVTAAVAVLRTARRDERGAGGLELKHARVLIVDDAGVDALLDHRGDVVRPAVHIGRVGRVGEVDAVRDRGVVRVFRRAVVARGHGDQHRRVPVRTRELDIVDAGVVRRRRGHGVEAAVSRRQHRLAVAELDCHANDAAGRRLRQFDRVQVLHAGGGRSVRRDQRAFEHDAGVVGLMVAVLGQATRRGRVELGDDDAGLVVVAHQHLDVAHDGVVEVRIGTEH